MGGSSSKTKFAEVVEVLKKQEIDEDSHFWNDLWKAGVTAQVIPAMSPVIFGISVIRLDA